MKIRLISLTILLISNNLAFSKSKIEKKLDNLEKRVIALEEKFNKDTQSMTRKKTCPKECNCGPNCQCNPCMCGKKS